MNKNKVTVVLLAILTISLIAVSNTQAFPPTDLSHLIEDSIAEPIDLDPAWAYDTASRELIMNVYETLLWWNRTNMDTFIPVLATEWAGEIIDEISPEGLTWVSRWYFRLDTTPHYFHYAYDTYPGEGVQVTTADVEYSFERILITDASTGPAWMFCEPLFGSGNYSVYDLNDTLTNNLGLSLNLSTNWNTECDEAIDHAIESNATHVWFNLAMLYEPFLQILANYGWVLNQAWCTWHGDWNGSINDEWVEYHDPATSPLYDADPHSPGPNLDAALGSGPYILDYWNKGIGNSWSVIKNPSYCRGWALPYDPEGWGTGFTLEGHLDRYTSMYTPGWNIRKLRFLGGISDFCDVPMQYMNDVLGWPGIECIYPLPSLSCSAAFMNLDVNTLSTHMGIVLPKGTFSPVGAPPDIFNDADVIKGFKHLFDYKTYLENAYLNESTSPVPPILPGLAYYDPTLGASEDPATNTRKRYAITGEANPATEAYNLTLASQYFKKAHSGNLWSGGFKIDLIYIEGDLEGAEAAKLISAGLTAINVINATSFTGTPMSIPGSVYKSELRARTLPLYILNWLGDFPDAHAFVHPFMHSDGALCKWQCSGSTIFPTTTIDTWIEAAMDTIAPATRNNYYCGGGGISPGLQQEYVDQCPSWILAQPVGHHFQRDWVEGWYYNPIYPGNYVYDLWKSVPPCICNVDVAVTSMTTVGGFEIGLPIPNNVMKVFPTINVNIARLDTSEEWPTVWVIIGFGLRNAAGYEIILGTETGVVGIGGTYTATFTSFEQDSAATIGPGTYTSFAIVLLTSSFVSDTNMANNKLDNTVVNAGTMIGDINVDGYVELMDFFLASQAFGSTPGHPRWDIRCDLAEDGYIELMDFFILSQHFGDVYYP